MTEITPLDDMRTRLVPTAASIDHAQGVLADLPEAEYAIVPMVLPGKQYGFWTTGQPVETVEGQAFACVNLPGGHSGRTVPSYGAARDQACLAASEALAGRPGTIATASVSRDGEAAIFEEFPAAIPDL
jgi:hypothetical protein